MPDDRFSDSEDLQLSLEELAATADQLHTDNEHLRERIKELTAIMESQMDELVEAERERDLLRQDVSNQEGLYSLSFPVLDFEMFTDIP